MIARAPGWFAAMALFACCAGCAGSGGSDGGGGASPYVTLTVDDTNAIGDKVTARIRVSSCQTVTQIQLLLDDVFLAEVPFTSNPAVFDITAPYLAKAAGGDGGTGTWWHTLGFAAEMTLTAKLICDGTRTATSPGVTASFFPVASRFAPSNGDSAVPDQFVAQGGIGATPVTFLGCVLLNGVKGLATIDTQGAVVKSNGAIGCDGSTQFSQRIASTGTRWVLQPGLGATAIDDNLVAKVSVVNEDLRRMGVGSDGSAVFFNFTQGKSYATMVSASGQRWDTPISITSMGTDPVIDVGNQVVWLEAWQMSADNSVGDEVVYQFDFHGNMLNGVQGSAKPPVILEQTFSGGVNTAFEPVTAFNADGSLLFIATVSTGTSGAPQSAIAACSTTGGACQSGGQSKARWIAGPFPGEITAIVPFSAGNLVAAVGPHLAVVLSTQTGAVKNLGGTPIAPSGSLVIGGVQPGRGTDLYLMSQPVLAKDAPAYFTEVIALDAAESGELYRLGFGQGTSAISGIQMDVDDSGQAWFRVGPSLVKPYALSWYRSARGTTVSP